MEEMVQNSGREFRDERLGGSERNPRASGATCCTALDSC